MVKIMVCFKVTQMKKIFYIVLIIVALMVISRFVKQGNQTVPTEIIAAEEVIPTEATTEEPAAMGENSDIAVDENGNPIADEETISEAEAITVEEAAEPSEDEIPADAIPVE